MRRFRKITLPAGVLLIALLAIGAAALGAASPHLDALSNALVHAIGAALFSILAIAMPRRALLILCVGGVLTLSLHPVIAYLSQRGTAQTSANIPRDSKTLKIINLNTWHSHPDHSGLLNYLIDEQADIVILSEFGPDKRHLLKTLGKQFPYYTGCADRWRCSMVLLSRIPWSKSGAVQRIPGTAPSKVWARFGDDLAGFTVIGTHIMRPIDDARTHLREMAHVAKLAGKIRRTGRPVLVAGDLNATRWAHSWRMFQSRSGLQHMGRYLPSWPSGRRGWPQLAIDHIFASPGIQFIDVQLGRDVGSDHRPVIAEIRLP